MGDISVTQPVIESWLPTSTAETPTPPPPLHLLLPRRDNFCTDQYSPSPGADFSFFRMSPATHHGRAAVVARAVHSASKSYINLTPPILVFSTLASIGGIIPCELSVAPILSLPVPQPRRLAPHLPPRHSFSP